MGYIPGSKHLFTMTLLDESKKLKPIEEILKLFSDCGVDLEKPICFTCGGGIFATIPYVLALNINPKA